MSVETKHFISPEDAHVAIALYNDVRTTLERAGWTKATDVSSTPGYWWWHADHPGTHSMSAAHGQWRLDLEVIRKRAEDHK